MTEPSSVVDHAERREALDIRRSFIVQAPAGSGKTELLTQRILALLSRVERPEEVLAITFTRKAAAEMRARLLQALELAAVGTPPTSDHERTTRELAEAVLERDRTLDWQLRRNPNRLQLLTIDSFCAHLVRSMPWLSRFGAPPAINEDARDDYRQAAERLLLQALDGSAVRSPVRALLRHLDNRLEVLRDMLMEMLARRDQWLRHLLQQRHEQSRSTLEGSLQAFISGRLRQLEARLSEPLREELLQLAVYAGQNLAQSEPDNRLAQLAELRVFPSTEHNELPAWLLLAELLLTQGGSLRSRVNKNQGFPADRSERGGRMKQRMADLLASLQAEQELVEGFAALRHLPNGIYGDRQWTVLEALVDLLPVAAAELEGVFRERGRVDFIAISAGARVALGGSESPEELLLQLDSRISHILVDEFQDTSCGQFELLERLVAGWQPGDGRTLFLVGDPMQSIYRFREAEVGLFLRAMRQGIGQVLLEPLRLRANFRSQEGLIRWANSRFAALFPRQEDEALGGVRFAAAEAVRPCLGVPPVELLLLAERNDSQEAQLVRDRVAAGIAREPGESHAILVRSRAHAREIAAGFSRAGISFQAQELEALEARPVIFDLLALTRALVHHGDRLAWLTVLRAPWCGLRLESLLTVCEDQPLIPVWSLLQEPARLNWLDPEDRVRVDRLYRILQRSLDRLGREPLTRVVRSAWLAIGGPACYGAADVNDAAQFFALLAEHEEGGTLNRFDAFEGALASLYAAPDPSAGPQVQIMTIHKAKGLEFDHVYLPGLGRSVRGQQRDLLRWLEHPEFGLLLAPIPARAGQSSDATYAAIGALHAAKERFETIRLLYVACTRARRTLTLLGHATATGAGLEPPSNSLLQLAWPALEGEAQAGAVEPWEVREHAAAQPPQLRRLPADWAPPELPTPFKITPHAPHSASHAFAAEDKAGLGGDPRRRHVGTVVHGWLEKIARDGLTGWTSSRISDLRPRFQRQLINLGYDPERLGSGVSDVESGLRAALDGEKGRWVLKRHRDDGCEVALSGIYAGERIEAVVDRTFVDDQDVRWVIDYKTSAPRDDESDQAFLQREAERYAPQVTVYVHLFRVLEPHRPVRGALYFPHLDTLHQVVELQT